MDDAQVGLDEEVKKAIENFIVETDELYFSRLIRAGTLVDPPEYMDYCKLCLAPEREHRPVCLLYPLWVAPNEGYMRAIKS
jgi:hypothetical protein